MKAWQVAEWGRQNLQVVERPIPRPGPGEVLIRVRAVSLNYRDKLALDGVESQYGTPKPYTPCGDLAGEVAEVGPGVLAWTAGDRVSANFYTRWHDGRLLPI
jgi:NADPH:quinone reductase-like Zn-dependent oxidoreductase